MGGVEEQLTGKLGLGAWEELQKLENAMVDSQLKKSESLCITIIFVDEFEFLGNPDMAFKHKWRYICRNSILVWGHAHIREPVKNVLADFVR